MAELLILKAGAAVFGLLSVLTGVLLVAKGRRMRKQNEGAATEKPTPVRDVRPGTVTVTGTAEPTDEGGAVAAPISGEAALATAVEVQKKSGKTYRTIHETEDAVPFLVNDGTGVVRVDPATEGRFDLAVDPVVVGPGEEPPAPVRRFLESEPAVGAAEDSELLGIAVGERRRYLEGMVRAGDEVVVVGEARRAGSARGDHEHVVDGGSDPGSFVLSDKSGDRLTTESQVWSGLRILVYVTGATSILMGVGIAVAPWIVFG